MRETSHARRLTTPSALPSMTLSLIALLAVLAVFPLHAAEQNKKAYGYSDLYGELTPTQVFSLVTDVDMVVMHYAKRYKPGAVNALPNTPIRVQGYAPEQVFVALNQLANRIDRLAENFGAPQRVQRVTREQQFAIPAEVFLLAGACLDTLADTLSAREPGITFGDFYNIHTYDNPKTPSDVYALVDLIDRKLTVLLGDHVLQTE